EGGEGEEGRKEGGKGERGNGRNGRKMQGEMQKEREIVGGFVKNVLLCSAKQTKTENMQHRNSYYWFYFYFTQTR
ncbi:MAG: hypothetical protein IJ739_02025, partial [Bacteroidaceae bacterium]|nr:hypothetical protein [Bacteroidaceae bacterium]